MKFISDDSEEPERGDNETTTSPQHTETSDSDTSLDAIEEAGQRKRIGMEQMMAGNIGKHVKKKIFITSC